MAVDSWANQERVDALVDLHGKRVSFRDISAELSARFGVDLSRCACIGKARRLGLEIREPVLARRKEPKPKRESSNNHRPVLHFVSNGAGGLTIIETRASLEEYKLRCVEIVPLRVSLLDIADDGCRYPFDGGEGEPMHVFCGHPQQRGSSFCTPHHYLCWMPSIKPERIRKIAA